MVVLASATFLRIFCSSLFTISSPVLLCHTRVCKVQDMVGKPIGDFNLSMPQCRNKTALVFHIRFADERSEKGVEAIFSHHVIINTWVA
jgi:hypothetical protein